MSFHRRQEGLYRTNELAATPRPTMGAGLFESTILTRLAVALGRMIGAYLASQGC